MNKYILKLKQFSDNQEFDLQGELFFDIAGKIYGYLTASQNRAMQNEIEGEVTILTGTANKCGPARLKFNNERSTYILTQITSNGFDLSGNYEGVCKPSILYQEHQSLEERCSGTLQRA